MDFVGKICPYCKTEFKEDDEVVICSVCEMPHHKECWIENKACTTFGCTGTIMGTNSKDELFCKKCGASYIEGQVFCGYCGTAVSTAEQIHSEQSYVLGQQQFLNQYSNNYNTYGETAENQDITAFIGENTNYFLRKFENFNRNNTKLSWNFASAFLGAYWYAYRKMYLTQFLFYVSFFCATFFGVMMADIMISTSNNFISNHSTIVVTGMIRRVIFIITIVLSGMFGNYLYKRHVDKNLEIAKNMDTYMKQSYMMKKGGTNIAAVLMMISIQVLCFVIIGAAIS